jgi:SAM-dependent methyltransferase
MSPSPDARETQQFYDEMWQSYSHLDAVSPAAFHRRRVVTKLAERVASGAASVLDVGCGQGELLRELAGVIPGAKIFGADISQQALVDSRVRNPTYDLFHVDLTSPTFAEEQRDHVGRFDLVVCSEVLEHIPDAALAARRLFDLTKPGGILIVTVPGGKRSRFDEIIGHIRHYTSKEMGELLERSGFRVERRLDWGFPFHSIYRTAVRVASRLTMGGSSEKTGGKKGGAGGTKVLGGVYSLFGKALLPLFYLNADHFGEQTVVVARKP